MNEEKEQNKQNAVMQQVVQSMLPEDLKKNFAIPSAVKPSAPEVAKLNPNFVQKPIRTYESDLADVLGKKQASVATIAIAESEKKIETQRKVEQEKSNVAETEAREESRKGYLKKILLGFLSLIFIAGGIMGGYYLYKQSAFSRPITEPKTITIPSSIPSDKQILLVINNSVEGNQLISQIYSQFNKESGSQGKILELLLSVSNKDSSPTRVTASTFIQRAGISMPDVIKRSITDRWMLGAYTEEDGQKTLFVALSTDFFQNVFAGMLAWENSMPDDMAGLFNYKKRIQNGDFNASTSISSYFNIRGTFSDKVIRNRDVREFRSDAGELLLLYSFINKESLVITTTESAFIAGIDRIERQTYVR